MCSVFLRLASVHLTPELNAAVLKLDSAQYACGVSGGPEALSFVVREFLSAPTNIALHIDIRNAFGNIHRPAILEALTSVAPAYVPFYRAVYGTSIPLVHSHHDLDMEMATGGAQGDPCMSAYFSLGLLYLLQRCPPPPGVIIPKYADDMWVLTQRGMAPAVVDWARRFADAGRPLGLEISFSKSTLLCSRSPPVTDPAWPGQVVLIDQATYTVLGVPFSTDPSRLLESILASFDQSRSDLQSLIALDDPQTTVCLSRCIVWRRLGYLARALPPSVAWKAFEDLASEMMMNLNAHLSLPIDGGPLLRLLPLPIRLGGLGLNGPDVASPASFLASSCAAIEHLELHGVSPGPLLAEAEFLAQSFYGYTLSDLCTSLRVVLHHRHNPEASREWIKSLTLESSVPTDSHALVTLLRHPVSGPQRAPLHVAPASGPPSSQSLSVRFGHSLSLAPHNPISLSGAQAILTKPLYKKLINDVLESASAGPVPMDRLSRWYSDVLCSPLSVMALRVIPAGTHRIEPAFFRGFMHARYRSIPSCISPALEPVKCAACGTLVPYHSSTTCSHSGPSDHALACCKVPHSFRHTSVLRALQGMVRASGMTCHNEPSLEEYGISVPPEHGRLRADFAVQWDGTLHFYDVTIKHVPPFQRSSFSLLYSKIAEKKDQKYGSFCRSAGTSFTALPFSPLGFAHFTLEVLQKKCAATAQSLGRTYSGSWHFANIACALARDAGKRFAICYLGVRRC